MEQVVKIFAYVRDFSWGVKVDRSQIALTIPTPDVITGQRGRGFRFRRVETDFPLDCFDLLLIRDNRKLVLILHFDLLEEWLEEGGEFTLIVVVDCPK